MEITVKYFENCNKITFTVKVPHLINHKIFKITKRTQNCPVGNKDRWCLLNENKRKREKLETKYLFYCGNIECIFCYISYGH